MSVKKPYLLGNSWYSTKECHLFSDPENVKKARELFLNHRPKTLGFLLEKRYSWMNSYIREEDKGIEIGCGTGLSKLFIKSKNFMITDFVDNEWIDKKVDAMDMPFGDSSLDYIIVSNVLHHLAKPYIFLNDSSRILKRGGKLIIQEVNASFLLRFMLRVANHEGYSYEMDVFDKDTTCNDSEDPWGCNIAIPNLLFDDIDRFEASFPFKVVHNRYTECMLWPLSGGIAPVGKPINLPRLILSFIDKLDGLLIAVSEDIFALQRRIVLENTK